MRPVALLLLLGALAVAGCAADDEPEAERPRPTTTSSSATPSSSAPPTEEPSPTRTAPTRERVRHLGIDASHHQGAIDWDAVADDGISFAYLKATEGATFTDPMFATNAAEAFDLGIEVAGYHYFSLCTPGDEQAEHFVSVIDAAPPGWLPPAVDVELLGSCSTPPPRDALLAEIRAFLDVVERRTGQRPVVYLFPDFEEEYGAAAELADYRMWVRDLDSRPERDWWVWQQTDSGSVDGVDGPVDVNVLFRREVIPR